MIKIDSIESLNALQIAYPIMMRGEFVLGGFFREVNDIAELRQAVYDGFRESPTSRVYLFSNSEINIHDRLVAKQTTEELARKQRKARRRAFLTPEDIDLSERQAFELMGRLLWD
jgi:hypothetical protein